MCVRPSSSSLNIRNGEDWFLVSFFNFGILRRERLDVSLCRLRPSMSCALTKRQVQKYETKNEAFGGLDGDGRFVFFPVFVFFAICQIQRPSNVTHVMRAMRRADVCLQLSVFSFTCLFSCVFLLIGQMIRFIQLPLVRRSFRLFCSMVVILFASARTSVWFYYRIKMFALLCCCSPHTHTHASAVGTRME